MIVNLSMCFYSLQFKGQGIFLDRKQTPQIEQNPIYIDHHNTWVREIELLITCFIPGQLY